MTRPTQDQKRDRQLNIALRRDEIAELQARADARGMRLVDYARAALLQMRVASYSVALPSKLERLNHEQLKRIGNNLNQIARQLNALGQLVPMDLQNTLQDIRELIAGRDEHGS